MNTERYVGDFKLHEMVEIAMEEDWDVCIAHMECIAATIGQVIAQGVASGEFEAPDLQLASLCACTAMMRFFHPQMIAQCANKPGPTIDQMIDFVLAGLVAARGELTSLEVASGRARHCERSEAIHRLSATWHGSAIALRFAPR